MVLIDNIKVFDFYKSLPEQVAEKTLYGALISCLMVFFIFFSIIVEINDYNTTRITSEMYVDELIKNHELKIFFNVTLPSVPCSLSPLIAGTTIDNADKLLTREINFTRLNKQGNEIGKYFMNGMQSCKKDFPIQLQNNEGCRIEAHLILLRVPGQISLCDFSYKYLNVVILLKFLHLIILMLLMNLELVIQCLQTFFHI